MKGKEYIMKFIVNGEVYNTKKDLQERIKKILYSYNNNEELNILDFTFIYELLNYHPNPLSKKGIGVEKILVRTNLLNKHANGFWIVRSDGSETDFSYIKCLTTPTKKTLVIEVFREAIRPYTFKFKKDFFTINKEHLCPYTGERINFHNSHVDHKTPKTFECLLNFFLDIEGLNYNDIELTDSKDNMIGRNLSDIELLNRWIIYHNTNADLRVISKIANLSHARLEHNERVK